MVIDVHLHPWCKEAHYGDKKKIAEAMAGPNPRKLKGAIRMLNVITEQFTLKDYVAIMDKFNIKKAIIVAYDVTTAYGFVMATNDDIADFVKIYPDKFIGFGCIDIPAKNAMEQLEYAIKSLDLKGIKLIPPVQKFDYSDKKFDPLWNKMIDLNVPLWTHGGHQASFYGSMAKYGHPLLIDDLASRHQDLIIIIGHMGVPWMWDTWSVVLRHQNVYVDISAYPNLYNWFPWDAFITEDLSHKILFASDYPLIHYSQIFNSFEKIEMTDTLRKAILEKNAIKLLKIKI
ncbi:MAG: amidohydrolase family protein [Promethearchaeota archaeon]